MDAVVIKTPAEIDAMRRAGRMAAETLEQAARMLCAGITTDDINEFVHRHTIERGGIPAPLNYRGFPKSVCTSVNEVICHGIPGSYRLKDGDIINVDVTTILDGWHGDVSATFYIGEPSPEARRLTETTLLCLETGIAEVRPGARVGDIGAAIQALAEDAGFQVVRDFVGHGIGQRFHEGLQVPHYGKRGRGLRLKPGMTFTIEPMINQGTWKMRTLRDGWTAVTADGRLSAQFEHTIAVTDTGCEILTAFLEPLPNSPDM
ncbi:MAG: type I methionyl aminopeptidase [Deltaproteobacteria bacterium]|nr:type I methionyl aminopeptidase [Deltaproteobacteria bacterium]